MRAAQLYNVIVQLLYVISDRNSIGEIEDNICFFSELARMLEGIRNFD